MSSIIKNYTKAFAQDRALSQQAKQLLPDGIITDTHYMHPFPVYVEAAQGAKKWTVSGHELIDFRAGNGALLFGHNPPEMTKAVTIQITQGSHLSACHPYAHQWAKAVIELVPSAEQVRFTASGTEANLLALQLARAYTGKQRFIRFMGHYHGWENSLIAGYNLAHAPTISNALICPPNDLNAIIRLFDTYADIACVILEPTGAESGVIPCHGAFLASLRELTHARNALLIFDEIVTGFRVSLGGAQEYYNILPDLTTLGKILVGGLPGGAVAGKKSILDYLASNSDPDKKMPHLGTFSGNPLSAVAGTANLKRLKQTKPYNSINHSAQILREGLNRVIDNTNWTG